MLPNMTGVTAIDLPRASTCELAGEFALAHLEADGKSSDQGVSGAGLSGIFQQLKKQQFKTVVSRNPTHPGIAVQRYTFGQWFGRGKRTHICSIF